MKTQISIHHRGCNRLIRLLALILALAVAAPVLLAQESDPLPDGINMTRPGRGSSEPPLPIPQGTHMFALAVFNRDGTFTQNIQGESAFDPAATTDPDPENFFNIITSPQSGVWQKTGQNTFAATFLAIEYRVLVPPTPALPGSPLFRFDKIQYTGTLNQAGDTMEITVVFTFFDEQGNQLDPTEGTPPDYNHWRTHSADDIAKHRSQLAYPTPPSHSALMARLPDGPDTATNPDAPAG